MDKYEYKIREDEIKELITQRDFEGAAEVADTIDWRRVKSVKMLCMVSDVYKKNRRYEDSRDMLLLAYDRHPGGRTIVYSLCELAIKMGDLGHALEYCKEFIQMAPKDPGRYILQYKLYEAQEVGLEERIAVLEELKKKDYREKWAYELALMYHKVGMETRCVEECDELILWFGEGKYVIKAMELKMQHSPLTEQQQEKYDAYLNPPVEEIPQQEPETPTPEEIMDAPTVRVPVEEIDIQVKTLGLSKCDTINLQEEVAAGLKELWDNSEYAKEAYEEEPTKVLVTPSTAEIRGVVEKFTAEETGYETEAEEPQEEAAESPVEAEATEPEAEKDEAEGEVAEEVITGEEASEEEDIPVQPESLDWQAPESAKATEEPLQMVLPIAGAAQSVRHVEPPKEMAKVLSMEGDGQISFVMPETVALEKQITGQMNFNDIMLEWERMKLELEEKGKENVRQMVLRNTGSMFTDFEASVRDGLLEQLENGKTMEEILPQAESLKIEEVSDEVEELEEVAEEAADEVEELEEVVEEAADEVEELEEVAEEAADEVEELEEVAKEAAEEVEELEEVTDEVEELEEVVEEAADEDLPESDGEITEDEWENAEEALDIVEEFEEYSGEDDEEPEQDSEEEEEESAGRSLTKEEKELFAPFIQGRESKDQLLRALDAISLAAYTGNVVITGREGLDTMGLAKSIIREIQMMDSNFSGKVAKISGGSLNKRDVEEIVEGLVNGALIIQKAGDINETTAKNLYKVLQQETRGIIVILEGTKRMMNTFFEKYGLLETCFNARIDMEALSDDVLVAFANKYARENECSIDEFGMLALHRTIADRQTSDHAVTIMEVKEIMDDAIASANRKTIGHFFSILAAKRYDEEDMIIIRENDFE